MKQLLLVAFAFAQIGTAPSPNIALRLDCIAPDEIQLTVANRGDADTAILFGEVLANGGTYLPRITLNVTRRAIPEPLTFAYHPVSLPGVVAGRIDPWILPLPAKGRFVFNLRTIDFVSARGRLKAMPADQVQIRFMAESIRETGSPDMAALKLWRVWTGKLESNPLQMGDCPLEVLRER